MTKEKTVNQVAKTIKKLQKQNKKVGLIFGCFDILHVGHIELFKFAKKYVDYLVIALESDKSITLTKGKNRPINKYIYRQIMLQELRSVDLVFEIGENLNHNNKNAPEFYEKMVEYLHPDCLVTNPIADSYWKNKQIHAKKLGIKLLLLKTKRLSSSTEVINKLLQN